MKITETLLTHNVRHVGPEPQKLSEFGQLAEKTLSIGQ